MSVTLALMYFNHSGVSIPLSVSHGASYDEALDKVKAKIEDVHKRHDEDEGNEDGCTVSSFQPSGEYSEVVKGDELGRFWIIDPDDGSVADDYYFVAEVVYTDM